MIPPTFDEDGIAAYSKFGTKTGLCVWKLQHELRQARFIYSSATSVSRPSALAPFSRLGLWSTGDAPELDTHPFSSFDDFFKLMVGEKKKINESSQRVMDRTEMVVRETANAGHLIARNLSFANTSFALKQIAIEDNVIEAYDKATTFWGKLLKFKIYALATLKKHDPDDNDSAEVRKGKTVLTMQFWAAHQRFFKAMMVATKTPYLIRRAKSRFYLSIFFFFLTNSLTLFFFFLLFFFFFSFFCFRIVRAGASTSTRVVVYWASGGRRGNERSEKRW